MIPHEGRIFKKNENIAQCLQNHTEGWWLHIAHPEEKDKTKQQRSVRRLRTTRDIKSDKPTKHLVCEVTRASTVSWGALPPLIHCSQSTTGKPWWGHGRIRQSPSSQGHDRTNWQFNKRKQAVNKSLNITWFAEPRRGNGSLPGDMWKPLTMWPLTWRLQDEIC